MEDEEPIDDDPRIIDTCPNCHVEYDEIDADYLICHLCHYNANFDIIET